MHNLDKYAAALCEQFSLTDSCCLDTEGKDCDDCELQGICHNPDKLLAFMMSNTEDEDDQLLQEPQGTE